MNNDVLNQSPENVELPDVNDTIYLLTRYNTYVDLFEDDEEETQQKERK